MTTPNGTYTSGVLTAGTAATKVLTIPAAAGSVILENLDTTNAAFVGGPAVTADETPTGGFLLPPASGTLPNLVTQPRTLPANGGQPRDLYLICSAGTPKVSFIYA